MQAAQQQLDLKDIHLPDPVSWWPPATGYWIILAIIVICIVTFLSLKAYRKKYVIKKAALNEFNRIKKDFQSKPNQKKLATSLSELLRRAAISTYPASECAGLTGKQWLNWLDKNLPESTLNFSNGPGYLLTEFIYSSSQHANDINDLLNLCLQWLKQLPPPSGKNL